jgi:hypothetical protein
MSKLNKKQRRARRKRKHAATRKRHALKKREKPQPWVAVKNPMVQMPEFLPPSITKGQRLEILRSIGSEAKKEFDEKYPTIQRWFQEYDALYLLSFFSYYLVAQQEGIDPEVTGNKPPFYHHYLEILQAFALYQERNFNPKPLMSEAETIENDMKSLGQLMGVRLFNIPENLSSDEEVKAFRLRTEMMMNTTAIRNWAYGHQMRKVTLDLCKLIGNRFKKTYGIDPFDFMQMLFALTDERTELLNEHRSKVRNCLHKNTHLKIIDAYNQTFPENIPIEGDEVSAMWETAGKDIKKLRGMLLCHSDLKLEHIYSFTIDEAKSLMGTDVSAETLTSFLEKLTLNFGDLKNFNPEHIILSNPTHHKPFIRIDDSTFFSAVWGIMPHLAIDILENLIWSDDELRKEYTHIKSKYLEDQVEEIFKQGFPSAKLYRGSLWTEPVSGKTYENDLTVLIDSFAVVVEAKSGSVSDPAKRGAPDRLFETLRELIEEPSEQALRLIDYFKNNKKVHEFLTKRGVINVIDNTKIKYYIPLGVTFSHLGMISSNLKKLIEAGVVKKSIHQLAPSMSFTDIDTVFELLPLEAEKIHYLSRRREFEAHLEYEGDELDLLAFYLDHGFNIGETEYAKDTVFNFSPKSKELDPYIIGKSEGRNVKKPELQMTKWWRDILTTIAARKIEGWIETSFILLNSTKEDQKKFQNAIRELVGRIKRGRIEKPHNWVLFTTGPERRKYAIAFYPYTTNNRELRNNIMGQIIEGEHTENARGVAVIGVNLNQNDYPYTVFARRMSTDLFDSLAI